MGIKLRRYPEFGVTFFVFSGALLADEFHKLFEELDRRDSGKWLSYGDATVEMIGLRVADLPALKRLIFKKEKEIFGDATPRVAMVYSSKIAEELLRFWQLYTLVGDARPEAPAIFSNLRDACDWLGAPAGACTRFEADIGSPEPGASGA